MRWTATNGFDDSIRNALRLSNPSARATVSNISTGVVATLAAFPVVVDAVGVAGFGDKNWGVAGQLLAVDGESFAPILGALYATKDTVARARPYTRNCPGDPNCGASDQYESFFSGHTSLAFNSAGLICTEHLELHLFGGAADGATCAAALAAATTAGVMRIMADDHYATDVLTGAALGAATGFLLPRMHFGFGEQTVDQDTGKSKRAIDVAVNPIVTPQEQGIGASFLW